MARARLLYSSENGDRWLLVRGPEPERVFVRHEPDAASGGQTADLEIAEFLIRGVYGPEHIELLRLIGTLVEVRWQKLEGHAAMVATYTVWYSFVRLHKSLRVTPATAAGITDRLWSMEDVVGLLDAREAPPAKRGRYKPRQLKSAQPP